MMMAGFRCKVRDTTCKRALALMLAGVMSSCGSEIVPTPVVNTPPTIQSLTVSSPRAEAEQEIDVVATVLDTETAPSGLTYLWTSVPPGGTFTGLGAQVKWKAPIGAVTPSTFVLTLTVSETYTSLGTLKENRVASSVEVHYNDSVPEIRKIVGDFLTDFGTFSVTPEQCVRNFSDNCKGKADELQDIKVNRANFKIQSAVYTISSVVLNGTKTAGDIVAPCTFRDTRNDTGAQETVVGTCLLTAVYESFRWWLCSSGFQSISTTIQGDRFRYSHP